MGFTHNVVVALSGSVLVNCKRVIRWLSGVMAGNEEFQQAVHRAVPDGHTFKGYPVQLVHRNARRAFNSCLKYVHLITHCVKSVVSLWLSGTLHLSMLSQRLNPSNAE